MALEHNYIFLQGTCKYFRYDVPDNKYEPPRWNHVLYPNEEGLTKIRDLQSEGVKNTLKKDEDGFYVNLARPCWKEYVDRKTGGRKKMVFDAPVVLDKENQPLPTGTRIGNGSRVTTKMDVYTHGTPGGGKAKAMRWESSRIDELIPYEPERDFTDQEERQTRNLDKQPEILF